jgi:hypothetical protein
MTCKLLANVLLLAGAGALAAQPAKDFQSVFTVDRKTLTARTPTP